MKKILFLSLLFFQNTVLVYSSDIANESTETKCAKDYDKYHEIEGPICVKIEVNEQEIAIQNKIDELNKNAREIYNENSGYDSDYIDELINYRKKAYDSWKKYRDVDCYFSSYNQGMSGRSIAVVAELCRLEMTEKYLNDLIK